MSVDSWESTRDDGHETAQKHSDVRVSFLLGLEPSPSQPKRESAIEIQEISKAHENEHYGLSRMQEDEDQIAPFSFDNSSGVAAPVAETLQSHVATKVEDQDTQPESYTSHTNERDTTSGRSDEKSFAQERSLDQTTVSDSIPANDLVTPHDDHINEISRTVAKEIQDKELESEDKIVTSAASEQFSGSDHLADQGPSAGDDGIDSMMDNPDDGSTFVSTEHGEQNVPMDGINDVDFVRDSEEQLTPEISDEDFTKSSKPSIDQVFDDSGADEDIFGQLAAQRQERDKDDLEETLRGQGQADDDFFAQITDERSPRPRQDETTSFIDTKAESAEQKQINHTSWDDVFADELLLDDEQRDPTSQPIATGSNGIMNADPNMTEAGTTQLEQTSQMNDLNNSSTTNKEITWDDAPDLADLLSGTHITDQKHLEQSAELSWDDAFADDDDFLAGFAAATAASATGNSTHQGAVQPVQTDTRQSYVPPTTQAAQSARSVSSPWNTSYSALPQPSLPTQNPVEPTVRAAGNYASPYDMPDDFAKPHSRKRVSSNQSSTHPSHSPAAFPYPQHSTRISSLPSFSQPQQEQKPVPSQITQQGFFEDLPVVPKKRSSTQSGRFGPVGALPVAPSPPNPMSSMPSPRPNNLYASQPLAINQQPSVLPSPSTTHRPTAAVAQSSLVPQLQAPARLDLYADEQGQGPMRSATVPAAPATSRYSPAPGLASATGSQMKYASQPMPRPSLQQYAPRTSSPLTYQVSQDAPPISNQMSPHNLSYRSQTLLETVQENNIATSPLSQLPFPTQAAMARESTPPPPPPKTASLSASSSPRKRGMYAPPGPTTSTGIVPPVRSHTSSPGRGHRTVKNIITTLERPASAQGALSPTRTHASLAASAYSASPLAPRQAGPQSSQFIAPSDERAHDPLQRWRGHPVIAWGSGGSIITAFPTYLPRYISGQALPMMQPGGGELKVSNASALSALPEHLTKFPGPLKKGKKKELLLWLKSCVERLEKQTSYQRNQVPQSSFAQVRMDEKVLLWKVLSLFVENDGVLDGTPAVTGAIKQLLAQKEIPNLGPDGLPLTDAPTTILPDAASVVEVGELRSLLKQGEAEKAVWHAVDQRLWGPAFLISSTLSKDVWKQVIQEFVRKEVRDKALAALFQVFAGNWDESIDELVSVSARAGFQMVNTTAGTNGQEDALAGLEKWRETLLLILSNRSPGDSQALVSIGKVLSGYGRHEAAHICFIFAGLPGLFGGSDDPMATFSLIGGDANAVGNDFGGDLESILLSEVYEYVLGIAAGSMAPAPHLQAYKLYHAEILAENGLRNEAQQYCDAVNTTIHSKTKSSAYYNVLLMQSVDTLQKRLSEAPLDSSSSWKPSIDKVSSSLWGKFNSFVAGEDKQDSTNNITGATEPAQFTRFAGDTPPMSSTPVVAAAPDLYGTYQSGASTTSPVTNSRYSSTNAYAPQRATTGNKYTPGASPYQPRTSMESSRSSQDGRPSFDQLSLSPKRATIASNLSSIMSQDSFQANGLRGDASVGVHQSDPGNGSPYGSVPDQKSMLHPNDNASSSSNRYAGTDSQRPTLASPYSPSAGYISSQTSFFGASGELKDAPKSVDTGSSSLEAPETSLHSYGYAPPDVSTPYYEAEHFVFDEEPAADEEKKTKKKSFMDDDDDDDLIARAAALKNSKPATYREPDDAVKRAAEADGRSQLFFARKKIYTNLRY